ncbi:MAG: hypothetical protein GXP33_15045 [Spirochaetes bacterium]|nr:hypothetical protein [Spirochaetota bacterium]
MSNREDFLRVLNGEKPERIPLITSGFWSERAIHKFAPSKCYDENIYYLPSDDPPEKTFSNEPRNEQSRRRAVNMAEYMDMATIGVGKGGVFPFGHGGPGEIQPVVIERTDQYKIVEYEGGHKRRIDFYPHAIKYFDFPVKEEGDMEKLELPDMSDPDRFKDIQEDSKYFKDAGFVPTGSIQGFFSGIHNSFMDFSTTMMNLVLKPDFMKKFTRILAEISLKAAEMYLERGVEVIDVCDDFGTAEGLLLSPELIRKYFIPWYEELAHLIHKYGAFLHLHSHGNIGSIMPDIIAAGVDIVNPFDRAENPNLTDLVKKYSGKVVFCGGMVGDLYRYSIDKVEIFTKRACKLSKTAGYHYIFMATEAPEELALKDWEKWRQIFKRERILK